jgi:hypothetical protein
MYASSEARCGEELVAYNGLTIRPSTATRSSSSIQASTRKRRLEAATPAASSRDKRLAEARKRNESERAHREDEDRDSHAAWMRGGRALKPPLIATSQRPVANATSPAARSGAASGSHALDKCLKVRLLASQRIACVEDGVKPAANPD